MIWKTTGAGSATLPAGARWSERRETRKQLLRFLVVGGTSVLVDLAAYRALGWGLALRLDLAKAISYWAGVAVGFCGNKLWTFESSRRSLAEPISYVALYAATMAVNVGCNRAVLTIIGTEATTLAFLTATALTTVLNFLGMRLVTFRRGISQRRAAASEEPSGANQLIHKAA